MLCFLDMALIQAARLRGHVGIINSRIPAFRLSGPLLTVQPTTQQLSGMLTIKLY